MSSTDPDNALHEIESRTNKVLTIETSPTPENIAKCNQQSQSPLFRILPPEIRNDIFSLALLQYEDLTQPYPEHDFCYRPGHRARRIVSTNLLLTCRRVWLEANHWPMEQAVHSFWFDWECRPASTTKIDDKWRYLAFLSSLTPLQQSRVKHIQISAQMYWLELSLNSSHHWLSPAYHLTGLSIITITIRHSDWWEWESDQTLRLETDWVRDLLLSPEAFHISEIRLELETLEWRANELDPILHDLKGVGENSERDDLHWEFVEPCEISTWSGPTNVGGGDRDLYSQRDKLDYRITTVKWTRCSPAMEKIEQGWREEGCLLKLVEKTATGDLVEETGTESDESYWRKYYSDGDKDDDNDDDGVDDDELDEEGDVDYDSDEESSGENDASSESDDADSTA